MYNILYSKQAIKTLRKLPRNLATRIQHKIHELMETYRTNKQVKSLKGIEANRLRVGTWRIIYTINSERSEIWIIKVASRGEMYKS